MPSKETNTGSLNALDRAILLIDVIKHKARL